jgi:hypothetical protein
MERRVWALALLLAACTTPEEAAPRPEQATFWTNLSALCGKSYAGRIAAKVGGGPGPDPYEGKLLTVHAKHCTEDAVRLDFHAGNDRSRTWVFSRAGGVLRLAHEHRKEDGTPDEMTGYGGPAEGRGTAQSQRFPADGYSKTLFLKEGLAAAVDNVWTATVVPDRTLTYSLTRPGREFTLEFDLSAPTPP